MDLFSFMNSFRSVSELINEVCSCTFLDCVVILVPSYEMCFIIFSRLYFMKLIRDSSSCCNF